MKLILLSTSTLFALFFLSSYSSGPANVAGVNLTGSSGSTGCGGSGCHGASSSDITFAGILLSDPLNPTNFFTEYTPNTTYLVTIPALNSTGNGPRFGFQATAVRASATNIQAGTFSVTGFSNLAVRTSTNPDVVEQTAALNAPSSGGINSYSVQFLWTSPPAGTGTVRFYVVFNGVDGNGGANANDRWSASNFNFNEAPISVAKLPETIETKLFPNPIQGRMVLELGKAPLGVYRFQIRDLMGRVLQERTQSLQSASERVELDVSGLPSNTYLMHIQKDGAARILTFQKL